MNLPKVDLLPEIESMANPYAELNSTKHRADKEMKGIRQELMDLTGPVFKGRADSVDLSISFIEPSLVVDGTLLKQQYPDIGSKCNGPKSKGRLYFRGYFLFWENSNDITNM